MKFDDLKFEAIEAYGESYKMESGWVADPCQAYTTLSNGIEVSVVRHGTSYGHEKGLYEMGVFHVGGEDMMHVEAWGDEIKGYLSPENVEKELYYLETLEGDTKKLKAENKKLKEYLKNKTT
jgi:hypothetical protein